jgi:YaiO family outer membrane protein
MILICWLFLIGVTNTPMLAQQVVPGPQHRAGQMPRIEQSSVLPDSVREKLPVLKRKQKVILDYTADYYQAEDDLLHHVGVLYAREWSSLTIELYALWAQRFGFTGQYYGGRLLPQLTQATYLMLEGTYSTYELYPSWSAGGTLVQGILPWLEIRGGYRYIQMPDQAMELYQAGIGFYPGAWEIKGWGFYSEQSADDPYSYKGHIKRFGQKDGNYIGFEGGYGPIAEGIRFVKDRTRLSNQYLSFLFGVRLNPSWNVFGVAGYHQEEFMQQVPRDRMHAKLGFEIKF